MDALESMKTRRSVREFTGEPVGDEAVMAVLDSGRWAPSGLNNQPWRFMEITDPDLRRELSLLTRYRGVVAGAPVLIAVFLDGDEMYDRTKDLMSAGAAVQNMLLAAHGQGLGACWLGEILAKREEAERLLEVPGTFELVAVVALGHPAPRERVGVRHPLEQLVLPPPADGSRADGTGKVVRRCPYQ